MSSQSASTRNASQATVNAYSPRQGEPESVSETASPVSVWWMPAVIGGAWVGFAYIIPAVADFLAKLG